MISRNFALERPSVDQFLEMVQRTNDVLSRIGITPIDPLLVGITDIGNSYLYTHDGTIGFNYKAGIPALAHEAYHRHALEHEAPLTYDERRVVNDVRRSLSRKVQQEVEQRHRRIGACLTDIFRETTGSINIGRNMCLTVGSNGTIQVLCQNYAIAEEETIEVVASNGRNKGKMEFSVSSSLNLVSACYHIEEGVWKKRPIIYDALSKCQYLYDVLSQQERYWAHHIWPQRRDVVIENVADTALVNAVEKLDYHGNTFRFPSACGSEGGAHFIQGWLKGLDMNDYEALKRYIKDGIYSSGRWGKGEHEHRLAGAVVDCYEGHRNSGSSVEDALGKTVDPQNMLKLISALKEGK